MRRFFAWLTGTRESSAEQGPPQPESDSPTTDHARFALDLYLRLKDQVGLYENVACSPLVVALALASLHAGARDRTAAQLEAVLRYVAADGRWQPALAEWRATVVAIAQQEQFVLGLTTGLWTPAGLPLLHTFREAVGQAYNAEISQADFSQAEPARALINQWFAGATKHLLNGVMARGDITSQTRLVSINALCFKGYWAQPFDARQTLDEPFWVNPHTKIIVSLMWRRGTVLYGQFPFHFADRIQVLELPYAGDELTMVFLLPEGLDSMLTLEHTVERQKGKLDAWLGALCARDVDIALPKFTVGSRLPLSETLSDMGVTDAFSREDADFSGMRAESDLCVSHMLHQTMVAIDEYGATDDATASVEDNAPRETRRASPRLAPMFRADHPFLFLIRRRASGQILFMGRVMVPTIAHKITPLL